MPFILEYICRVAEHLPFSDTDRYQKPKERASVPMVNASKNNLTTYPTKVSLKQLEHVANRECAMFRLNSLLRFLIVSVSILSWLIH